MSLSSVSRWFPVVLVLAALQPAQRDPAPLAPASVRLKLRTATSEIAKTGEARLVARMHTVLAGLGDDEEDLAKLASAWQRTVTTAAPGRGTRTAAAARLRRELAPLVAELEGETEPRRLELARWILELDSGQPEANALLGRARSSDGQWLTEEEARWRLGAGQSAELAHSASRLEFEIARGTSDNPVLARLGDSGNVVRCRGIELHSHLPPETLERILRQALRAAAFSHGLLRDTVVLPKLTPRRYLLLDSEAKFEPALDEARASGALSPEGYQETLGLNLRSFSDGRGWVTAHWRSEADFEALLLWGLLGDWIGPAPQPCLRVGHLNWVCLNFLGASMPMSVWLDAGAGSGGDKQRSSAQRDETLVRQSLWRSARQSLYGCRAWMVRQVREQKDPPWARAMLDQEGKIRDENLLKTTLVCEFLQQEGKLWELIEGTRQPADPVPAIEKRLGQDLPRFEQRWRRWLDPTPRAGVLQELEGAPAGETDGASPDEASRAALLALNHARADGLKDQAPEIPVVALDPELVRNATLHARYLSQNAEQKGKWPDVHEEFSNRPGFTPAGALSGSRSVVAFGVTPEQAIAGWLGGFYHRLPLLDPGLFGVGLGRHDDVIVLDVRSLVLQPWKDHAVVWPLPGAERVPRRFVPELPNPVPGTDMASLGYPISLQLFFAEQQAEARARMELFRGEPAAENRVRCHFLTPDAPLFPELAPRNAWCLVPEVALEKSTRYTVRAEWAMDAKTWSFTTGE